MTDPFRCPNTGKHCEDMECSFGCCLNYSQAPKNSPMTNLDLAKIKEAVAGARHGPKGCLLIKTEDVAALIARLEAAEARNATAYAEGVEAAAKAVEAYKRDASFDDSQVGALEHNSNEENIVCAIRSLLKDKPNG